jgi:methionyl-tRNA synthetase
MPTEIRKKPYFLTTPIYYVNARPHLGHTYTTVAADVIARWKRLQGYDVRFLTGTDEHGQKIERSAAKAGQSPLEFAGAVSAEFRALWDRMGLTYDDYIRTTEERHKRGVQRLFAELQQRGFIYKGTYTGQYCVSDELYVDGPVGTVCPDCGRLTETVSEENYYFKLSEFGDRLLAYYEAHPEFIQPAARRNEVMAFVRGGLRDLSISRTSFNWGIPVPGDEKHVIYVWMDALANYITALGYGSDAPEDRARFAQYWPADLHLIGKEISRFHCVYWPAFLMAAGLPLPKSIVAHGWLLFEQSKMSKSRGNIVRAETILDVLGADALRYFLLREIVFGQDGGFSFDALVQRYNADLANGYGNLVSRTLTLIQKYFDGVVPEPAEVRTQYLAFQATHPTEIDGGGWGAASAVELLVQPLAEEFNAQCAEFGSWLDGYDFSSALTSAQAMVAKIDGFLTGVAPWKQSKVFSEESQRAARAITLYAAAESIRIITALLYPVMPDAAAKVWAQLGLGDIAQAHLKELQWGGLKPGTRLGALGPVFPRAEKDAITRMQEKEEAGLAEATAAATQAAGAPAANAAEPKPAVEAKPTITIDDFAKVELRVAQIRVAERVPGADRLLRLEVDLGYEQRQIVAGIAEAYAPESLIGRKVVIVANLAPRKLRGLESNGMVVAASLGEKGKPVLAGFLEEIAVGARLK